VLEKSRNYLVIYEEGNDVFIKMCVFLLFVAVCSSLAVWGWFSFLSSVVALDTARQNLLLYLYSSIQTKEFQVMKLAIAQLVERWTVD
jgi:hypothetical protein